MKLQECFAAYMHSPYWNECFHQLSHMSDQSSRE